MSGIIIYIGGYGRSGSTVLDAYLSSSEQALGVGEASNFFEDLLRGNACSCGERLSDCPYWCNLAERFLSEDTLNDLNDCTRSLESLPFVLSHGRWDTYQAAWAQFWAHVFKNGKVAVDSSKTTRLTSYRPLRLEKMGHCIVFLYLYRDPLDLLSSIEKGSNKALARGELEKARPFFLLRSFLGWFLGNARAAWVCRKYRDRSILINYKEFCGNPERIIDKLSNLGVELTRPVAFSPGHGVSGNRGRATFKGIKYEDGNKVDVGSFSRVLAFFMAKAMKIFILLARPRFSI